MPLILRPDHDSGDGVWLVYCKDRERSIGRIYRKTAPAGNTAQVERLKVSRACEHTLP